MALVSLAIRRAARAPAARSLAPRVQSRLFSTEEITEEFGGYSLQLSDEQEV